MEGSYEFVQCFITHAMDHLCPLDLFVLKRVSKTFYKYISKYHPNFGIERNLFRFATTRDGLMDMMIVKRENIRTGLDNGLTLFGSYLQAVMLMPFEIGSRLPFTPKDVDFFCLDRQLALQDDLFGKKFFRVPMYVYQGDSCEKIQRGPFDLTTGPENAVFHIGKSDFPFERMFYSRRTGFQTESLAGLLTKEQKISMPSFSTQPKSSLFVRRVLEFASRGICHVVITFDSQSNNLYGFGALIKKAFTCSWQFPGLQVLSRIEENQHLITIFTRL